MKRGINFLLIILVILVSSCQKGGFEVKEKVSGLSLYFDGQLITRYLFADSLQKTCFHPLNLPNGKGFVRSYPLEEERGESTDHLHHIGLWFSYGEVNDVDFWTTTWDNYGESNRHGKIKSINVDYEIVEPNEVLVKTENQWVTLDREKLLTEYAVNRFWMKDLQLIIDRETKLVAGEVPLRFKDSKEGMYAIRVADKLRQDQNGLYKNSEGQTGDAVWGQRAKWVMLENQEDTSSVLFIDHRENVNFPTYWMARGYGLFSANPLGQAVYENSTDSLNLILQPGDSVKFSYRVVLSDRKVKESEIHALFDGFQERD